MCYLERCIASLGTCCGSGWRDVSNIHMIRQQRLERAKPFGTTRLKQASKHEMILFILDVSFASENINLSVIILLLASWVHHPRKIMSSSS